MIKPTRITSALLVAIVAVFASTSSYSAETHVVQMLNKHPTDKKKRMVYYPAVVYAKPGDTIKYMSKDKGHNVESMKGMLPAGVEKFKSKISRDFELKVTASGVYGVRCTPHYGAGMVGLVVVAGDGVEAGLAAAKKVRKIGRAKRVFNELFDEVESKL